MFRTLLCALLGQTGIFTQLGDVGLSHVADVPSAGTMSVIDSDGNAYASPGDGIACSPPTGGGPYYMLPSAQYPGRLFGAADPIGGGVLVLVFNSGLTGGPPRASLHRLRCGMPQEDLGTLDLTANTVPSTSTDVYGFFGLLSSIDATGRLCQAANDGLYCFNPGATLSADLPVSSSALISQLMPANATPHDLFEEIPASSPPVGSHVGPLVFAPDGTIYALFNVDVMDFQIRWLIQRATDGTVLMRYGPELIHTTGVFAVNLDIRQVLSRVSTLAIDARSQTLLAFPRAGRRLEDSAWAGHPVFDGIGAATFPLQPSAFADVDRPGHIELSAVLEQTIGNPTGVQMLQGPSGVVQFQSATALYALSFDPDKIDMDEDGLSASEEATFGSSDYAEDSDHGGSRDGLEVRLYMSSPTNPADDMALTRRHLRDLDYVATSLIRERLNAQIGRQYWPSEYLCGFGSCYDRQGKAVLSGKHLSGPVATEDPGKVLSRNMLGTEIERITVATGAIEPVASIGDLVAFIPTGGNTDFVPGKGNTVFMVSDLRVIAFGDAPVRVVFDLNMEMCRSKLSTCGPTYLDSTVYLQDLYHHLLLVGYDPVIDRLLVLARGNMDDVLIGVSAHDGPVVLARGNNMPEFILDTGMGQLPSAVLPDAMTPLATGELWATYEGAAGFVDGDYIPYDSHNAPYVGGIPGRGWDDSLFVYSAAGPTQQGLFELERLDARIEPGDVLVFAGPNSLNPSTFLPSTTKYGPYLYKVGRRGGVLSMYSDVGLPGNFSELGAVRGMGIAGDGRICAAAMDGRLYELDNVTADRHLPDRLSRYNAVMGASDCLYGPDGKMHVLIESPPGVLIFDTRSTDPGTLYPLMGMSTPSRFLLLADGSYRIADAAGPMMCADVVAGTMTPTGLSIAGLTMGNDGQLFLVRRPEGELATADPIGVCGGATTPLGMDATMLYSITARSRPPFIVANIAQRPDGRLLVMPARSRLVPYDPNNPLQDPAYLFYYDPADKSFQVAKDDFDAAGMGAAMVRVPGGSWTDPWGALPLPGVDGGPGSDGATANDGGTGPNMNGDDGGGCGCATTRVELQDGFGLWLLAALVMMRPRRSGRWPRSRSSVS